MFPLVQPFANEWITFGGFFILIFILIGISELARIKFHWSATFNRKFVHVMVGIIVCCCPFIFKSNLPPSLLAGIFVIINWLAVRKGSFKGMNSTEQESLGTVYFPLSFLLLALFWWGQPITLIVAMTIMTFADTGAAVVGEHANRARQYTLWSEKKSLEGSVTMFLLSFGIVFLITIIFSWYTHEIAYHSLGFIIGVAGFVAVVATLSEAISCNGSDNLSVPLISAIVLDLYLVNYSQHSLLLFLGWSLFSFIIFYLAYRYKSLTMNGAVSAFIIGIIIFGVGGIRWITPLVGFFIFSSLLSGIGKANKKDYQKGSTRDILQVLANGSVATILSVVYFFHQVDEVYILFLAAIAAATADTWATEIGFFSRKNPRHILTFQPVEKGTSGGITFLGTFGSILGATLIAWIGWIFGISFYQSLLIIVVGFGGSMIDSILGGSIQSLFVCSTCGKTTEKRTHCNQPSTHHSGWSLIDNDMVNLINTISGVVIIFLIRQFYNL